MCVPVTKLPIVRGPHVNKTKVMVEKVQWLSLSTSALHILRGPPLSVPSSPVSQLNIVPATVAGVDNCMLWEVFPPNNLYISDYTNNDIHYRTYW